MDTDDDEIINGEVKAINIKTRESLIPFSGKRDSFHYLLDCPGGIKYTTAAIRWGRLIP